MKILFMLNLGKTALDAWNVFSDKLSTTNVDNLVKKCVEVIKMYLNEKRVILISDAQMR